MWLILALSALLAPVDVLARDTTGRQLHTGRLVTLAADAVTLELGSGETVQLAPEQLRQLEFAAPRLVSSTEQNRACWVDLRDGSRVRASQYEAAAGKASIQISDGTLDVDTHHVARVRFDAHAPELDTQWKEIVENDTAGDVLVIRRSEGALDYLQGVVVAVSKDEIVFEFDGQTIPVPRGKIDGVIYFHAADEPPSLPRYQLTTLDASRWNLDSIELGEKRATISTTSGVVAQLPYASLSTLEFSGGNFVFLSDIEPTSVTWTSFIGSPKLAEPLERMYRPRRDQSFSGGKLSLADTNSPSGVREFDKGLAIHSRTQLVYRLGAQYRRLTSLAGIDAAAAKGGIVRLEIAGDGRPLFASDVSGQPIPLDVDVGGVQRLTILVDFGEELDIADRLNLCNARLIK